MPTYQIKGTDQGSSEPCEQFYYCYSEDEARAKAAEDNINIETLTRLPNETAPQAQIQHARLLGIEVPENPAREQLSYLISAKQNLPASPVQISYAKSLGIELPDTGKVPLSEIMVCEHIQAKLPVEERGREIARLFVYSVLRDLIDYQWDNPFTIDLDHDKISEVAETLMINQSVARALRDQMSFGDGYYFGLLDFRPRDTEDHPAWEGVSRSLKAYHNVKKMLNSRFDIVAMKAALAERKPAPQGWFERWFGFLVR